MAEKIPALVLLAVLASGCAARSGTRSDSATGLVVRNNGLAYRSAAIYADGARLRARDILFGKDVALHCVGVKGFVVDGGKVFPGASLSVIGEDGAEAFGREDVFAAYAITGADPSLASVILVTLTVGKPMERGREYLWRVRVWDKRGPGEIVSEMKFRVK